MDAFPRAKCFLNYLSVNFGYPENEVELNNKVKPQWQNYMRIVQGQVNLKYYTFE